MTCLLFSLLASTYFFLCGSGRDGRLATVEYECSGRFGPKATAGATCWLFVSDPSSLLLLSALLASLVLAALNWEYPSGAGGKLPPISKGPCGLGAS
jgi:hypothetical protein